MRKYSLSGMIGSEAPRALLRFFFSAVIVSDRGVPPPFQQARRGGAIVGDCGCGTRSPILSLLSVAGLRLSRLGAPPELRRSSQCLARAAYAGGKKIGSAAGYQLT